MAREPPSFIYLFVYCAKLCCMCDAFDVVDLMNYVII